MTYTIGEVPTRRVFARASHETFTIPPIRELIEHYVGNGLDWADPYCGRSKLVYYRNDMDPSVPVRSHLDAFDFVKTLPRELSGILIDPPYSRRQCAEHYRAVGRTVTYLDTSYNYVYRVMRVASRKIRRGGIAITCGWNSNGFPMSLGWSKVEVLVVAHGMSHHDTIVVVDRHD
jgi:hypothetical protein